MIGDNQGWGRGYQPASTSYPTHAQAGRQRALARARAFFAIAVGISMLLGVAKLAVDYRVLGQPAAVRSFPVPSVISSKTVAAGGGATLLIREAALSEDDYVVRLADPVAGTPLMTLFMRPHITVSLPLPVGRYALRIAHGTEWHGLDDLFGAGTHVDLATSPLILREGATQLVQLGSYPPTRPASPGSF